MFLMENTLELIGMPAIIFPNNTAKTWANTMKDHGVILKQGRPHRLSTKEVTILHEFVKNGEYDMSTISFNDLADDMTWRVKGH